MKNMGTVAPDGPQGFWPVHTSQRERRELFVFCVCWLRQMPFLVFGLMTKSRQSQIVRRLNHIFFLVSQITFFGKRWYKIE